MARTFTLHLDGSEFEVEQRGRALLINGKRFEPEISGDAVTVEGTSHKVEIDKSQAFVDGILYPFETEGLEVKKSYGSVRMAPDPQGGDGSVTAIMPGLIIKVLVDEGDKISSGDVLVILEAMKMESEICSPKDGVVKETHIKAGDNVAQNQILVTIE